MFKKSSFLERIIENYSDTPNAQNYSDEQWPIMVEAADRLLSLLSAQPPGKILDLACGAGAVTTALALRGYDVLGIDCTPAQINIARKMSPHKKATAKWLCEDIREIPYESEFDYVCLRDVIFGVFETREEDCDLIQRIARALKPGGKFLLEVYNREFALKHGIEDTHFYNVDCDRFIPRNSSVPQLTMGLWDQGELIQMLASQGLQVVNMTGWNWPNDPEPLPWRADLIVSSRQ